MHCNTTTSSVEVDLLPEPAVPLPSQPSLAMSSETESSEIISEDPELSVVRDVPDGAYIALLDKYTETFFQLDYLEDQHDVRRPALYPSKIAVNRAYYVPQKNPGLLDPGPSLHDRESSLHDRESSSHDLDASSDGSEPLQNGNGHANPNTDVSFDALPGSLWEVSEKEMFFRCLARYSIHRIDAFIDHLPNKSEAEIRQYYSLLKNELSNLSTYKEHRVVFQDKDGLEKVPYWYISQTFEDGATYSDMPAARELSDEWIAYEEAQSVLITSREQNRSARTEQLFRKQMLEKHGFTIGRSNDSHEYGIINTGVLIKLSKMYRAGEYGQETEGAEIRMLRIDTTIILNQIVRQRTQEIISALIVNKGLEGTIPGQPEFDFSENGELYHEYAMEPSSCIGRSDIYRACDMLGLFEAPASGFRSRNRDGKTPVIDSYWQNLILSMKLKTDKNGALYAETPQVKYYENHALGYAERDALLYPIEPQQDKWDYDGNLVDFSARGEYEVDEDAQTDGIIEKSPKKPTEQIIALLDLPDAIAFPKVKEDALVEEILFIQETQNLDSSDFKRDLQLHTQDTRRQEIKRRKIEPPKFTPTEQYQYFKDMWGEIDMDNFCDAQLRQTWNHTFARY